MKQEIVLFQIHVFDNWRQKNDNLMKLPSLPLLQESETGSWHVPIAGNDSELERTWLCVTRPGDTENIEARGSCVSMSVGSYNQLHDSARKRKERPSSTS